jgi:hypothetical protein
VLGFQPSSASHISQEELDLEALAREAQRAIAVSKDAHQHSRDQYVAVIVKVPTIAVKYPMTGGQVTSPMLSAFSAHNSTG